MIHYPKIIELLHRFAEGFVGDFGASLELLRPIINRMVVDKNFWNYIQNHDDLPIFHEHSTFNEVCEIQPFSGSYVALGVDGSQIYPDRHTGLPCFLLHIGSIAIQYGSAQGQVTRTSEPYLFTNWETYNDSVHTNDVVDTERFLKELQYGLEQAKIHKKTHQNNRIIMFIDGPLLFWHCAQKPIEFQKKYFSCFAAVLQDLEKEQIAIVGYTSMPRSRELSKIVKKYVQYASIASEEINAICTQLIDTQLVSLFLRPQQRTASFTSNALMRYGLEHPRIDFVYFNTGSEYVRLEMPSWVSDNEEIRNFAYASAVHQIKNGFGYPTVLALAHEEAVIKNADRLFFIKMFHKVLYNCNALLATSQKQIQKDYGAVPKIR